MLHFTQRRRRKLPEGLHLIVSAHPQRSARERYDAAPRGRDGETREQWGDELASLAATALDYEPSTIE